MKTVFLDTGPLVALFRERDQFHQWVKVELSRENFRFITCEAVLTETLFITKNAFPVVNAISSMIKQNLIEIKSALISDEEQVFELLNKYRDQKTSLADISLLVLYNETKDASIFTTDSDFYTKKNAVPFLNR